MDIQNQDKQLDDFKSASKKQADLFECALRKIREDSIKISSLEGDIAALKMSIRSIKLQAMCIEMDIMRNELSNLESLCAGIKDICAGIKKTIHEAEST